MVDGRAAGRRIKATPGATRLSALRRHLWPLVVMCVSSLVLVIGAVSTFTELSPVDEGAHFDYIVRFPDVPVTGDTFTQETMELQACQGMELDYALPACDSAPFEPVEFPGEGFSTAGTHPPLYYGLTALLARPLAALTGVSLFVAARAIGALWLALLMILSYAIGITLGASRKSSLGASLLLGSSSAIVTSASTLGPDIAAAAMGALLILVTIRTDRSRPASALVLIVAALLGLTKLTTFLAVGVAVIWLVAVGTVLSDPPRDRVAIRKDIALALAVAASFLLTSLGWLMWASSAAVLPAEEIPINQWFLTDSLDPRALVSHALLFFTPISDGYVAPYLQGISKIRLESIAAGIMVFGAAAAFAALRSDKRASGLGLGVLTAAVVGAPLLVLVNFYANGMFFQLSARYGYPLLGAYAACAAVAFRNKPQSGALVAIAGVVVAVVILQAEPFSIGSL